MCECSDCSLAWTINLNSGSAKATVTTAIQIAKLRSRTRSGAWKGAPRRQRVAAVRRNRAGQRLHEKIGVSINQSVTVSLTGERLPASMRARMASQTWSTLIWSMQERSQGQSFHRQHGEYSVRPVRLVLSEYPDCEGSSLLRKQSRQGSHRARQMHRKADEPQEEFRGGRARRGLPNRRFAAQIEHA